jgi:hypothetical protein
MGRNGIGSWHEESARTKRDLGISSRSDVINRKSLKKIEYKHNQQNVSKVYLVEFGKDN